MNTYRPVCLSTGLWQVLQYRAERIVGPIGPQVKTEVEALLIAYRLARAEIIDPPWRPVWEDPEDP